jgi:hypothetical protein
MPGETKPCESGACPLGGDREKFDQLLRQVGSIHQLLVGFEGHGGLVARVEQLETKAIRFDGILNKVIGAGIAIGFGGGGIGYAVAELVKK